MSSEQTITKRMRGMGSDSIRSKILWFALLATLLPSLATAWLSYVETRRSLTAEAAGALASASTQTARELDLWIKERRYDLRVFASSYEVTENLERLKRTGTRLPPRLAGYLNSIRERFPDYSELTILDTRGSVVASTSEHPGPIDLPDGWQNRLHADDFVVGKPYWNKAAKRPEVRLAVPIAAPQGGSLGAIAAKADLSALAPTLRRFAAGRSSRTYVATDTGRLIVGSIGVSQGLIDQVYPAEAIRTLAERNGEPAELRGAQGDEVIASLQRVPGVDWIVVAETPSTEVFAELRRLRNVTLLIVVGMLLVASTLGYSLGLFIVRPLDRLTRGAAKVAGGDLDVDLPVATGGEVGYLTQVFNNMVSRLRDGHRELERLSVTDPLTGLYNRRRMMEAVENEVRRARRLDHPFTVLMADVDHFKPYNDQYGHPAGDVVLKRVAAILLDSTRDVDLVARYGGEEFFVLMPETEIEAAAEIADAVRRRLAAERLPAGHITLSFGLAEFPSHGDSGEALIAVADAALYQAKRKGRDQVVVARTTAQLTAAG
jgi:diguanylate cyclase (GGDEF)-like protein